LSSLVVDVCKLLRKPSSADAIRFFALSI
jgi:hypothetical protein